MDTLLCGESFWNSTLSWDTQDPILSRCVRQSVLQVLPCLFLWIIAPLELLSRPEPLIVSYTWMTWSRIGIASIALGLNLIDFIAVAVNPDLVITRMDLMAPGIRTATFILVIVILFEAKCKHFVRSPSVWLFAATATFFGSIDYYHLFKSQVHLHRYEYGTGLLHLPVVLMLLIVCSIADESQQLEFGDKNPLRNVVSLPSFFTFSFIDRLMYTGFRRELEIEDLDQVRHKDKTLYLGPALKRNMIVQKGYGIEKAKGVGKSLFRTFFSHLMIVAFWKMLCDGLGLLSPFLLKWLLAFIASNEPTWHGIFIAVLMFLIALGQNLFQQQYLYRTFNLGLRVKTAMMTLIYRKALRISNSARRTRTVGEIVNLMSVDTNRFYELMQWIHFTWIGVIQIALCMWMLYGELGSSTFAGVGSLLLILPVNAWISAVMEKATKKQMSFKDERVKSMNEILSGIKVLKLYAWERAFMQIVNRIRKTEIGFIRKIAFTYASFCFTFSFIPVIVTLVTFTVYVVVDESHVLDPGKVFFSLTVFNIIRSPLMNLPYLISHMVQTYVSLKRVNTFFAEPDVDNYVTHEPDDVNAVSIKSAVLSWTETDENGFTLKIEDIRVPTGSLVAVVGIVGSGKSSLLSSLLCEMHLHEGRINISPDAEKIAYVPQQAWIQNKTVKENILFGKDYDSRTYRTILNACELQPDLAILAAGDQTEIGEKGINLSGGQKQRLSLARACYSDSDLYLFDDPLSAVDAHVAKKLFDNVFSSKTGFLRSKTRILVTNSLNILSSVDKIFVLKEGRISESGSYKELIEKSGDFSEFLKDFGSKANDQTSRQESVESKKEERFSRQQSTRSRSDSEAEKKAVLVEEEKREEGAIKLSVLKGYFKHVSYLWAVILFLLLNHLCDAGVKYWLSRWSLDKPFNSTGDPDADIRLRNERLIVYGVMGFVETILLFLAAAIMAIGSTNAAIKLHEQLLAGVLKSPMSFFETTPLGRIVNRFGKDMESVDMELTYIWLYVFDDLFNILNCVIMMLIALPIFLVIIIPLFVVFFLIQRFYIAASRQFKRFESTTRSPIYSMFSETLAGISTIRAYDACDRFQSDADKSIDVNVVCAMNGITSNRWLSTRLQLIGNVAVFSCALFAVWYKASIDPGMVGLAMIYAMDLSMLLNFFLQRFSYAEVEMVAVERILEYTNNSSEADWDSTPDHKPPTDWPSVGNIEFSNYSTRYRPGLDLVVHDINARINDREKIGIVGRTGAGKSTITLSLFRILEPASGTILIDNLDTSRLGLYDVRKRLTIIPQDPVLFSGTLRTNLDPSGEHSDEQLWKSLELAHLKDFVKGLENGLDYKVAEGGENLSVGQRQLICLARALLRKTKILVLDEATAAVDMETDSLIQSTIRSEFADCTILTIAHRLHTILDSDRVIVMDSGKIVEFESPNLLLKKPSSIFHSLAVDAGIVTAQP